MELDYEADMHSSCSARPRALFNDDFPFEALAYTAEYIAELESPTVESARRADAWSMRRKATPRPAAQAIDDLKKQFPSCTETEEYSTTRSWTFDSVITGKDEFMSLNGSIDRCSFDTKQWEVASTHCSTSCTALLRRTKALMRMLFCKMKRPKRCH